jgi:hypothetical protein
MKNKHKIKVSVSPKHNFDKKEKVFFDMKKEFLFSSNKDVFSVFFCKNLKLSRLQMFAFLQRFFMCRQK